MQRYYSSFGDYMVVFDIKKAEFKLKYKNKVMAQKITIERNGEKLAFCEADSSLKQEYNVLSVKYKLGGRKKTILFSLNNDGIKISVPESVSIKGMVPNSKDFRAMSTKKHDFMRAAAGNVCTTLDDMLFDTKNDSAIILSGNGKKFSFNYKKNIYEFDAIIEKSLAIKFEKDIYAKKYGITYAPINKDITFKKPPVGWMTWYAVKFNASEKTVLENTKWMAENLKKYGAETVWVDWEWYHKDLKGVRDDGTDTFHPDKEKYPNGLRFVSDEIRKHGFVPSLWIGFVNDPAENEYIKKNPEIVLIHKQEWCGQYFFDFSHPKFLNEFLPKALSQVDEWGYEAVKFDTLPITIEKHEKYHENMYNPELTTKDAFRGLIKKTREILGYDRYMMSCCGYLDSDILWACDMFDGARVGGDIFNWKEFIEQGIGRTARFYPLHNTVFYNDPDNVVIREEFNNFEQAKSRVAFVSLLGLPVTLGDNLPELPEERVELIRRGIPVMDIHPMDICRIAPKDTLITNLSIGNEYEEYNVVSIMNTTDTDKEERICFDKIGIDGKKLFAFEYYSSSMAEIKDNVLNVSLKPYETKIFAVRKDEGRPQIVSTSRHIYQGALEIEEMNWDNSQNSLAFTAELIEKDLYTVSVVVPDDYMLSKYDGFDAYEIRDGIYRMSVTAKGNEKRNFKLGFDLKK